MVSGSFFYADDIAIVGRDATEARKLLAVCEAHSRDLFNPKKYTFVAGNDAVLSLYGKRLERVDSFVYLGVDVNETGAMWNQHFERRLRLATSALKRLKGCGFHGFGLGERTNLMAYKAIIRPALEFGLSAMPPAQAVFKLLDRAQVSFLRQMFSPPMSASSVALRVICALPTFELGHTELQARRFVAVDGRSGLHMSRHALRVARSQSGARAKSSFRAWDNNPIEQRYCNRAATV